MHPHNGHRDFLRSCIIQPTTNFDLAVRSQRGFRCLKLVSLNVARPQLTVHNGTTINTGIFKKPVSGPVPLRTLNLDGDRQADLSVHGGPNKAVYAYPSEHYPFWQQELPGTDLPFGMFGENFTTEGLCEDDTAHRRSVRIGSAIVMVRQPRIPCYKLAAKFQRDDMIERFLRSGRSGFYFSVEQEGTVAAGDIVRVAQPKRMRNYDRRSESPVCRRRYNRELLHKAMATADVAAELARILRGATRRPTITSAGSSVHHS